MGLALILSAGCVSFSFDWGPKGSTERSERFEFSAEGVQNLFCKSHNGRIQVQSAPRSSVVIEALIKASGSDLEDAEACLAAVELDVRKRGSTIHVTWKWSVERQRSWQASVLFDIAQPDVLPVEARTHNGAIGISGLAASCKLETHNGAISLKRCSGAWDAETHNGAIAASGSPQNVSLRTHNGRVEVELETSGELSGSIGTHNGSVRVALPDSADTRVVCESHNGGIKSRRQFTSVHRGKRYFEGCIGHATGTLRVETHNGSITLDKSESRF